MENIISEENKYTLMQKKHYEGCASKWNLSELDHVVGSFNEHNNWRDYELLFINIPDLKSKIVLDFGCGPGRNIVKYSNRFARIDGVDISQTNLEKAKVWMEYNNIDPEHSELILCNGVNLDCIENGKYDIVMSTICLQHICVYEIRYNYFREFYRILREKGYITIQMGFGIGSPFAVDYYSNNYEARETNGLCDTNVVSHEQIERDLLSIGFKNFNYYITKKGPEDNHPHWIFFSAQK